MFTFDKNDTKISAQNKSIDGDFALYVTLDASHPDKNQTQMANLTFLEHKDHYYLNGAQIWYSENNFPGGSGAEVKMIWVEGLTNFPTPKNSSHACDYAAELQLNVTDTARYGLQMKPANWEAFSDFGSRTELKNPNHCPADNVATTADAGAWNITTSGENATVCGKIELAALININYTSILQEDMTTGFAMPNNSVIDYPKASECFNDSISVTFMMKELDYHFANMTLNFTTYQQNENTTKYWAMTGSSITYMSGNNPFFPNSDAKVGIATLSKDNLNKFNTTYGYSYKCHNTESVNVTNIWNLTLSEVRLQPFNISTDGTYGAINDCSADIKDDWLVPVIVGSVLGGLVIVVVIAYIIGRRRSNNDSFDNMNHASD